MGTRKNANDNKPKPADKPTGMSPPGSRSKPCIHTPANAPDDEPPTGVVRDIAGEPVVVETSAPVVTFSPPPQQSKPNETPQVDGRLTCCPKCKSTNRSKYSNRRAIAHGVVIDGITFTHVVWRNTKCLDCGQARVDKHHENRPGCAA